MRSRAFVVSIIVHLAILVVVLRAVQRRRRPPVFEPISLQASPPPTSAPPPTPPPPTVRPRGASARPPSASPQAQRPAAAAPQVAEPLMVGGTLSNVGEGGGTLAVVEGVVGAPIGPPRERTLSARVGEAGGGATAVEPSADRCHAPATRPEPLDRPSDIELTTEARASGVQGRLVLRLTVGVDGSVGEVAVLQSVEPALDGAAIVAVKSWRFRPALRCGRPVESSYTVARRFELGD